MKNNGFTLIELLAVIVILAIISLIATPIILGMINDSKDSAAEANAKAIVDHVTLTYTWASKDGVPTMAQVAEKFKMEQAKLVESNGSYVFNITDENVTCVIDSTELAGNNLKVTCTAHKDKTFTTSEDLPIEAAVAE